MMALSTPGPNPKSRRRGPDVSTRANEVGEKVKDAFKK
jgi:hypothetical protein